MITRSAIALAFWRGFVAAKQSWLPALLLQAFMVALAVAYFVWPSSRWMLDTLGGWKAHGGIIFSAVASALAGGLLAEVAKVGLLQGGRWGRDNTIDLFCRMFLFGLGGAVVHVFYDLQALWFGHGSDVLTVATKVLVDMGPFNLFWAVPFQTIFLIWRASDFDWSEARKEVLTSRYFTEHYLPVIVSTWLFWLPVVSVVYAMPTPLQFPMFLIALAIWSLLLVAVSAQAEKATSCEADFDVDSGGEPVSAAEAG